MNPASWQLVAALVAGGAALVWLPSWPRPGERGRGPRIGGPGLVAAVSGSLLLLAAHQPLAIGWVVAALVVGGGARWQVRRARSAARSQRGSASVVAACDGLVADLAAGAAPAAALVQAAEVCAALAPVAETAGLGGDVVTALHEASQEPGCGDLRLVGAAWQVSDRAGVGLAFSLSQVAGTLRARGRCRRVVATELSSARATARLMAGLPLLTWLLGAGTGAAPWKFLLGTPAGLLCLVAGLGLSLAGVAWIDGLARRVEHQL